MGRGTSERVGAVKAAVEKRLQEVADEIRSELNDARSRVAVLEAELADLGHARAPRRAAVTRRVRVTPHNTVVAALAAYGPCTAQELAERASLKRNTVSVTLSHAKRAGLVRIVGSKDNGNAGPGRVSAGLWSVA